MGLYGIGKGLFKMSKGIVTGDVEEIAKGGDCYKCHRMRDS